MRSIGNTKRKRRNKPRRLRAVDNPHGGVFRCTATTVGKTSTFGAIPCVAGFGSAGGGWSVPTVGGAARAQARASAFWCGRCKRMALASLSFDGTNGGAVFRPRVRVRHFTLSGARDDATHVVLACVRARQREPLLPRFFFPSTTDGGRSQPTDNFRREAEKNRKENTT